MSNKQTDKFTCWRAGEIRLTFHMCFLVLRVCFYLTRSTRFRARRRPAHPLLTFRFCVVDQLWHYVSINLQENFGSFFSIHPVVEHIAEICRALVSETAASLLPLRRTERLKLRQGIEVVLVKRNCHLSAVSCVLHDDHLSRVNFYYYNH